MIPKLEKQGVSGLGGTNGGFGVSGLGVTNGGFGVSGLGDIMGGLGTSVVTIFVLITGGLTDTIWLHFSLHELTT